MDEPTSDITPIPESLRSPNDGGPDFSGDDSQDDNRTTDDPLHPASGDASGESDAAMAVGMASNADDGTTATQNGGGGL